LTQTFYSKAEVRNQSNRALGTEMNFKGEKKAIDDVYSDAAPDGGAYASLNDLLLLMTAMHQGKLPSGRKYPKTPLAGGSNYWNTVVIPFEDGTMVLIMSNLEHIADELGRRVYNLGMGKSPAPLEMPREQQLYKNLKEKGISYIEKNMKSILSDFDLPYDARFLNYFGYRFMNGGDTDAALELFALNTRLFPKQANTYDSLGEAWLKKGNNAEAIRWYKKALEVDPAFGNARKMLDQLENK
jgi:tetratricopeptide (TPR) repeat protein